MRRALILACAFGLSAPMAFAECTGHKVNAAVDIDRTITTASVVTTAKQSRLPPGEDASIPDEQPPATAVE